MTNYTLMVNNMNKFIFLGMARRSEELIGWQKTPLGWVKVNTDGVHRVNINHSCYDGLIIDENGTCLGSFSRKIDNGLVL